KAATGDFITREIFEALRNVAESGATVTFSAIEGRLDPQARDLLHSIAAADENTDDALAIEQAQACLRRLETDLKKKHIGELRAKVRAAEREGRMEEALRIIAELRALEKEMDGSGGS